MLTGLGWVPGRRDGAPDLVEGVLGQYLCALISQEEMGKTTLTRSLVRSLLAGQPWAARETRFAPEKAVVVACTDDGAVDQWRASLPSDFGGRLIAFQVQHEEDLSAYAQRLRHFLTTVDAGLFVLDGIVGLVDVLDNARAHAAVALLVATGCPTLVIHHSAKGTHQTSADGVRRTAGLRSKGMAEFAAAYRQSVHIVAKADDRNRGTITLEIKIDGNYIADSARSAIRVEINLQSLIATPVESIASAAVNDRPAKRERRTPTQKAQAAAYLALELGLTPGLGGHNAYAIAMIGGRQNHENPARAALLAKRVFDTETIKFRTLADLIRKNEDAFEAVLTASAAA